MSSGTCQVLVDLGDDCRLPRLEPGADLVDEVPLDARLREIERGADQGAGAETDGRADRPAKQADEAARHHSAKSADRLRLGRSPHHDLPAGLLHHDGVVVQRERALLVHVVEGAIAAVCLLL